MAEQALKQKVAPEKQVVASAPAARAPAANSNAVAVVVPADAPTAPVKAKKTIGDSQTYQNNRKNILATLQTTEVSLEPFGKPNLLRDRLQIVPSQPLPQHDRTHAKAFHAIDLANPKRECFALVVEPYFPHRDKIIDALKGVSHPNLLELIDGGVVYVEAWQEARMVLFYAKPNGVKLSELLAQQPFSNITDVVRNVVAQLVAAMTKLDSLRIVHGAIHPNNIYIDEKTIILGDCIAQPCGYDVPDIYEPTERLSAPIGMRGNPTLPSDIYSVAILALDVCGLLESKKQFNRASLYPAYLRLGAYNVLIDEDLLNSQILDLLRGCLCEKPLERWGLEQLQSFAGGKRYNLIPISTIKEVTRPYNFSGGDHITLRSLANAYAMNWDSAMTSIADSKLVKWLDTLLQKSEIKEQIEKMHQRASRTPSRGKSADEVIAKTISTLDPFAAIRLKNIAIMPSAIPQAFAESFKNGDLTRQIALREVIDCELAGYIRDLNSYNSQIISWSPEQVRLLINSQSAGFGLERVLYELNPTLPCMSRNYAKFHSLSAKHMMMVLEHMAKEKADGGADSLYDKHLLAFLTARSGIVKELKFAKDFSGYSELQNNKELQAIMILASVQEKLKIDSLPALTCLAALKIAQMIEQFHGTEVRKSISRDLLAVLPRGKLSYLLKILHNKEQISRDVHGYAKAVEIFVRNNQKIKHFKNKEMIARKAEENGQRIAICLSLILMLVVMFAVSAKYILE